VMPAVPPPMMSTRCLRPEAGAGPVQIPIPIHTSAS
jgi:hypothetical protein